jgi:septin family protein
VEDEGHSDFIALRTMIIKTNLNDLRDVTHYIHYENYRFKKLSSFHPNETTNGKTIQTPLINKLEYNLFFFFFKLFFIEIYYLKLKMKKWKLNKD